MNICKGFNGGPRPGAGRPRKHSKGVSHSQREKITSRTPLHINFKYNAYVRTPKMMDIISRAIHNCAKHDFNVTHFSLQSNHIHLIAETKNNSTLTTGMRSLTVTLVRGLNKGSIQLERYHLHVLKTPREVRNALDYVLHNDIKHTGKMDKKYTKVVGKEKSWLLTSSSTDIASVT